MLEHFNDTMSIPTLKQAVLTSESHWLAWKAAKCENFEKAPSELSKLKARRQAKADSKLVAK